MLWVGGMMELHSISVYTKAYTCNKEKNSNRLNWSGAALGALTLEVVVECNSTLFCCTFKKETVRRLGAAYNRPN